MCLCLKVPSAESMKKNKLQCHLETNHPKCVDNPVEFLSTSWIWLNDREILWQHSQQKQISCLLFICCFLHNCKAKKSSYNWWGFVNAIYEISCKVMIGEK